MFLKLNLFKALIKKEWQGARLVVGNDGEGIYLTGMENGYWSIYLEEYLMTKKAKAAIIELIGAIPLPGNAANFWKNEEDQWEELDLLQKTIYKPDITYFKTQYIDTGVRICDYGRGAAVLQNMNTLECNMLPENIVSMVDSGSREKGEGMISPPLSQGKEIYWQNEACTLRCGTFKPREGTKEQFILWEMEKYDFSKKQQK